MSETAIVDDPYGLKLDAALPFVSGALDPVSAARTFSRHLLKPLTISAIRVTRHKPGRRCVIEYDVRCTDTGRTHTMVAKARAKGTPRAGFEVAQKLWKAGFDDQARDGITVPRPLALIPEFHMSIFEKVVGTPSSAVLLELRGVDVARRIARVAHKLHSAGVPAARRHSLADELAILRQRFNDLTGQPLNSSALQLFNPSTVERLNRVLLRCEQLRIPEANAVGIHRDFYPAQVIVNGDRCCLLDLDLYCEGDPALDIGNFVAHITEHALRTVGDPDALRDREEPLIDEYLKLSSAVTRERVDLYKTLTLARHIFISTQFPDRQHTTEQLLRLVETRLGRHA